MHTSRINWLYVGAIAMISLGIIMFKGTIDQQTLFPLQRDAYSYGLVLSGAMIVFSALVFDAKSIATAWLLNVVVLLFLSYAAVDTSQFDGLSDFLVDAGLKFYGHMIFLGYVIRIAFYFDKSE